MIKMYMKLLREESGLKALESRALRNMSGPKSNGTVQPIFRQWMEKITSKFGRGEFIKSYAAPTLFSVRMGLNNFCL
jgi:hypothetical protein